MTDQELKDLVASLAIDRKETERQMQETAQQMKETDRKMQETDRMIKELQERNKELSIQIGGINDNIGHHAEQFFQDVFRRKLEFGMVKYDEMIPNLMHKDKGVLSRLVRVHQLSFLQRNLRNLQFFGYFAA